MSNYEIFYFTNEIIWDYTEYSRKYIMGENKKIYVPKHYADEELIGI